MSETIGDWLREVEKTPEYQEGYKDALEAVEELGLCLDDYHALDSLRLDNTKGKEA